MLSYVILAGLALFGLHRRPRLFAALAIANCLITPALDWQTATYDPWGYDGPMLMVCFFVGAALFLNRSRVPASSPMFAASAATAILLLCNPVSAVFAPLPLTYAVVWLGLRKWPPLTDALGGDYSYGLYLIAFPVSQFLWWVGVGRTALTNLAWSIPITGTLAVCSWHLLESRAMRCRKAFAACSESLGARLTSVTNYLWRPLRRPERMATGDSSAR
jgi:peptidoglycan/LPS O-acetylase OafA/YrhL